MNELTPTEVVNINNKFIEDTGLKASLTPSRSNGFLNILLKMQSQANDFLSK
jgi:cysteine desulfuration protein SufE